MRLITLDFETYWSQTHTLTKMTPIEYARHQDTELQTLGVKVNTDPTFVLVGEQAMRDWVKSEDFSDALLVGHNLSGFDAMLCVWRLGIRPKLWGCTLAMARELGLARTVGGSLKALAAHYGLQPKLSLEATNTKGRKLADFSAEELRSLIEYNKVDVDLCFDIFRKMSKGFAPRSMKLIDITIRMLVEPRLHIDRSLLKITLKDIKAKQQQALLDVGHLLLQNDPAAGALSAEEIAEFARTQLASAPKFAAVLQSLGVEVPMKPSPSNPDKRIPALSKTDEAMTALLEHDDIQVASAAAARLQVKSVQLETRLQRFLDIADTMNGLMPIALTYYGAENTGRWCLTGDHEVLTPAGWVRLDQWKGGDIMQWAEDGSAKWAPATLNQFDYTGVMYSCDTKHTSFCATPEHKFPRVAGSGRVELHPISELAAHVRFCVPAAGKYDGGLLLSAEEISLLCAAQADGSLNSSGFAFGFRRPEKTARLCAALDAMGVPYKHRSMVVGGAQTTYIYIHYSDFPYCLTFLTGGTAKNFSYELLELRLHCKAQFIGELALWDGWSHPRNGAVNYATTNEHNKDFVVALCATAGVKVGVHSRAQKNGWNTTYQIYIKQSKPLSDIRSTTINRAAFSGAVYCPTTETGMFLVRHGERVHVTGNSGAMQLNQQNLPRVGKKPSPSDALRRSLRAPKGHKIVVADLSGIELRMNHFLWQVPSSMELFKKDPAKADLYKAFASRLYHVPESEVTTQQRMLGKIGQLQLQYSSSAAKFRDVARLWGAPMSENEATKIVHAWRKMYVEIVRGWRRCNDALQSIARGIEGIPLDPWGLCVTAKDGIRTPRGFIRYPGLEHDGNQWQYHTRKGPVKIFGAKIVENAIQSLSRDAMADMVLKINVHYPVVHTVHDEVVLVVPEAEAEAALGRMQGIMRAGVDWFPQLVTWSEGGIGDNYGDAKS